MWNRNGRFPSIARMSNLLYIAACVFVPLVWGVIVVFVSNRIDQWAKRRHKGRVTHIDYHI